MNNDNPELTMPILDILATGFVLAIGMVALVMLVAAYERRTRPLVYVRVGEPQDHVDVSPGVFDWEKHEEI